MFTGIVEAIGEIRSVVESSTSKVLEIHADFAGTLSLGQSVAVDGACLTVTDRGDDHFTVRAIDTTLSRTLAKTYVAGARVNLERAIKVGHRLDGHMVQGHVDGVGKLVRRRQVGETWLLDVGLPQEVEAVTILHGSVTLNGVSLTVNELMSGSVCQVALIPFTWEHTNLSGLEPGSPLNVEGDVIGKYVQRLHAVRGLPTSTGDSNAV